VTAASEPGTAIWTRGLTKRYARLTAVDGLDLEIPSGVVAGFVGPNGAGKTTTLRMLVGLVRPTAGEGAVLGAPLSTPARYLGRVGVLIESAAFYPGLSGERNLAVQATLAGIDMARIPAVLDRVGLASRGRDRYKTYSLGMKQRLAIAAGLLGQPSLLILDEPANGLDPAGIKDMRDLLGTLRGEGITVFVSSHQLGEVEHICDWLVVIDRGQMRFQGPTRQLMTHGGDRLRIRCQHAADLPRLASLLARAGLTATRTGDQLWVDLAAADDGDETVAEVSRIAMAGNFTLTELTVTKASLEDRYLTLIEEGHQS
jgi:ABC-2 type transport system ATP-binding protein